MPEVFDKTYEGLSIRTMRSEDLSAVVHIEQISQASPWARLSFEESITRGDLCLIVENQAECIGYLIASAIVDELHLLNIVCADHWRGKGIGHLLMDALMKHANELDLTKIFLEVRSSNGVAQSLYQKWGFKQIGLRKHYYRANPNTGIKEDALIFCCEPS